MPGAVHVGFALGAAACAAAAVVPRGRERAAAPLTLCVALSAAAAAGVADDPAVWLDVAVGAATGGLVAVVLSRFGRVPALSWVDAVMAGTAVGALATALGADARPALALAGVAGGLALSRWQPTPRMLVTAAGALALGLTDTAAAVVAAPALAYAAWAVEPRADVGESFRWTVLAAIIAFASMALGILAVNQFTTLSDTAGALAIATVLSGMGRAGVTITARIRESDHRARCDELTGLANRRHLLERLTKLIEHDDELALLLIDLDGFKELNDTLGHHAGDEVLRQIGPRLMGAVRGHDALARLGGDEFGLVVAPGDEAAASSAALRVRMGLEQPFDVEGITVHINASVGIALFPMHSRSALGLLQRADVAMYEAKRNRSGHEVYLAARDMHSRERLALIGELRSAIDSGQLVLHYQPKASLTTGAVTSLEALVRWRHPERGLLLPEAFLPIAEQSGLARALTVHVVEEAIEQMAAWARAGLDLTLAVNLGPTDLLDVGLPSEVARLLERAACPPERIQLEVSEDVIMADPDRTIDVLQDLRALGVAIALDDFGAGHSSLSHLRVLEIDELKIDRSFVLRMGDSPEDNAIVRASIDLGRRLNLRVVAEGVATAEAWELLSEWGCEEVQGFLLASPMPAAEVPGWLLRHAAAAPGVAHPRDSDPG